MNKSVLLALCVVVIALAIAEAFPQYGYRGGYGGYGGYGGGRRHHGYGGGRGYRGGYGGYGGGGGYYPGGGYGGYPGGGGSSTSLSLSGSLNLGQNFLSPKERAFPNKNAQINKIFKVLFYAICNKCNFSFFSFRIWRRFEQRIRGRQCCSSGRWGWLFSRGSSRRSFLVQRRWILWLNPIHL